MNYILTLRGKKVLKTKAWDVGQISYLESTYTKGYQFTLKVTTSNVLNISAYLSDTVLSPQGISSDAPVTVIGLL